MRKDSKRGRNGSIRDGSGMPKGITRKSPVPLAAIHTMDAGEKILLIKNGVTKSIWKRSKINPASITIP